MASRRNERPDRARGSRSGTLRAAIGEAVGCPVRWLELSLDAERDKLLAQGLTASFADNILTTQAEMIEYPKPATSTVEGITGRPTTLFHQWAADHADDFRRAPQRGLHRLGRHQTPASDLLPRVNDLRSIPIRRVALHRRFPPGVCAGWQARGLPRRSLTERW